MYIPDALIFGVYKWRYGQVLRELLDEFWRIKYTSVVKSIPMLMSISYNVTDYTIMEDTWYIINSQNRVIQRSCGMPAKIITYIPKQPHIKGTIIKHWYKDGTLIHIKEYVNSKLLYNEIYRCDSGYKKIFYGYYKLSTGCLSRRITKIINGKMDEYTETYFTKNGSISKIILYINGHPVKEKVLVRDRPVAPVDTSTLCSLYPLKNVTSSLFRYFTS